MSIEFWCDSCNQLLRVPDGTSGRKSRCPGCGAIVIIPAAENLQEEKSPPASQMSPPAARTAAASGESPNLDERADLPAPPSAEPDTSRGAPFETGNPYQAPYAYDPFAYGPPGESHPVRVPLSRFFSLTWEVFLRRSGMIMAVVVVAGIVEFSLFFMFDLAIRFGLGAFEGEGEPAVWIPIAAMLVSQLLAVIIQAYIAPGRTRALIDVARGGETDISVIFSSARYFDRALLIGVLFYVVHLATVAPPMFLIRAMVQDGRLPPDRAGVTLGIYLPWMFVGAAISVGIALIFGFAIPALVDKDCTAIDSLRVSRRITAGNRITLLVAGVLGTLALVALLFILALMTSMLAFILGPLALLLSIVVIIAVVVFAVALFTLFPVVAYLLMSGQDWSYPHRQGHYPGYHTSWEDVGYAARPTESGGPWPTTDGAIDEPSEDVPPPPGS